MWPLLSWTDAKRWRSNQIEWSDLYTLYHPQFLAALAAEAELGALFMCVQEEQINRLVLEELGHPQPETHIHCDNATSVGIANGAVKMQ